MAKATPRRPRTKLLEIPAGAAVRGQETGPTRQVHDVIAHVRACWHLPRDRECYLELEAAAEEYDLD